MKLACQINSYAGDGTPLKTKYKFCYLELDIDTRKGEITFKEFGEYSEKIKFNLQEFKIQDTCMTLKATNEKDYGRLDLCLGDFGSAIYDLACINEEIQRLTKIFNDTPNYFAEKYFGDKNTIITEEGIRELARKNFDANREDFRKNCL